MRTQSQVLGTRAADVVVAEAVDTDTVTGARSHSHRYFVETVTVIDISGADVCLKMILSK